MMSNFEVRVSISFAALRMEDCEERSRVRDLTGQLGVMAWIEEITVLILEAVREARMSRLGECREMARAMCSPRELGLAPTRRTLEWRQLSLVFDVQVGKERRVYTIFAFDLL